LDEEQRWLSSKHQNLAMIISVINQKGGVGKTTTAVNLAACASQHQQPLLLVDLDPQGNATSGLGLGPPQSPTLYESLVAATQHENNVPIPRPALAEGAMPGLKIIGASPQLAGSEIDLAENEKRDDLKRVLGTLEPHFPLILIDTPPSLSLLTISALVAADYLIIPVQCEYYALEGLGQLLRTLELIKRSLNPRLQVLGIVRTMYDARLGLSSQVSQELDVHFPKLLFKTIIPRNVRLAEAPSHGQPISVYDRRSPGADAYRRLAVEMLQRLGATYDRKTVRYSLPKVHNPEQNRTPITRAE
jgi:chromosome partitioning protein